MRIKVQTWRDKIGNLLRILSGKMIFFMKHLLNGPEFELFNVFQVALLVKEVFGVLSTQCKLFGHFTEQFLKHGKVILVSVIILAGARIEEKVSGEELESYASQ